MSELPEFGEGSSAPHANEKDLLQTKSEPIQNILKCETEEAEELFSDIRLSQYVLDIHDLNK